jgi:ribosomal protein L24E
MVKCSYCTSNIEAGTGIMFVKKNGALRYYCSDRCYKANEIYGKKPNKKEIAELTKAKK